MTMTQNSDETNDDREQDGELQGTPGLEEPDEELPDPMWRTPPKALQGMSERTRYRIEQVGIGLMVSGSGMILIMAMVVVAA